MKCADLSRICAAELDAVRRRLAARVPCLSFVALVVVDEHCDARPDMAHVETQVTNRPDFPIEMRADVLQEATDRVRSGKGATAYIGGLPVAGPAQ